MKYRNITLLLVVGTFGAMAWQNSRRLDEAREKRRIVREQAANPGNGAVKEALPPGKSKVRETVEGSPGGKVMPEEDVAFLKDMEERAKTKTASPPDAKERFAKIFDHAMSLNPAQLRKYIAELRALDGVPENTRRYLIEMSIKTMAAKSPAEGMDMAVELDEKSPPPMLFPGLENVRFESLLGEWAAKDPAAAVVWLRANLAEHGKVISENSRSALIRSVGATDRKLAFRLIGELGIDPPSDATQGVMATAKTAAERTSALADLREYLPTVEDADDRYRAGDYAIAVVGEMLAKSGFQEATEWTDSAQLTQSELISFVSGIGTAVKDGEQGKWIEWLQEKLPSENLHKAVREVMIYWTDDDYQAAGKWLASTPAGPAKNSAIMIYADNVSRHEPEAAVQWAVTLPEGGMRRETLHRIYHNWPKKDAAGQAAAAAFEQQYHIQHDH
jgi:hypothetical protein